MSSFFSQNLYKFLSRNTDDNDEKRKIVMLNSLSLSGSVFLLIMSIILIIEKSFFYAYTNILFCLLILVFYLLIYRGYNFKLLSIIIIFFVQLYFIFLFITGAGRQTSFVWYYLYPLITFFILEIKYAVVLSLLMILITAALNILSLSIPFFITIPAWKLTRIILSYSGVCLFTYIFEKTRLSIQKKYDCTLKEMQNLTRIDSLTGLYNRRYMNEIIESMIIQSRRISMKLGFIMTDIDYFKKYNDKYGHPAGDDVLIKYSELMKCLVKRKTDYIFRYGGEEFLLILYSGDYSSLENITESLVNELKKLSIPHDESPYKIVTVSAGAVFFESPAKENPDRIIKMADNALYEAKKSGRNCFRIYDFSSLSNS